MITWAGELEMGVGRFSRSLRGVAVLAMPDVMRDTMGRIESACEIATGTGVLQ